MSFLFFLSIITHMFPNGSTFVSRLCFHEYFYSSWRITCFLRLCSRSLSSSRSHCKCYCALPIHFLKLGTFYQYIALSRKLCNALCVSITDFLSLFAFTDKRCEFFSLYFLIALVSHKLADWLIEKNTHQSDVILRNSISQEKKTS